MDGRERLVFRAKRSRPVRRAMTADFIQRGGAIRMPDERSDSGFLGWLDRHGPAVLKVARAYTRTAADGQDLAQEILLQLWRSAPGFRGEAGEATWVYRVALNTAL